MADFSQCIEQQPDFAVTYVARSQTWLQLGEFGKALADCDQALALDQNLFPAWMARGVVLSEQQRHEDALACFDRSVELRPLAAVPMTNRGEAKRQIGIAILQERDPAKNQIAADYFVDAIRDFTRVLERRPLNTRAYLFRVQTRAAMGQTEQALRELQQGIVQRGEPRFVVECYRDIGLIQLASGEFQAALWSFERALKITTDNPEVPIPKQKLLLLKNETLKHLSSREDLLASLSRYLEIDQTLGEVFWERGLVQQRLGLFAEAMQDFTRLLDADSNHRALALTRRGWMYLMHANRFAEQDFDNAIALQPENPDLYNGRGFARAMNGKYVEAIADAERAVKLIRPEQAKLRVKVAVWALYFNAATIYGQAVSRVENDSTRSDAERTERREAYTSRAIALLDLARESADSKLHGRIAQAIKREPSFESIRDTDAFGEMVKRLSVP